jgi:predicted dehydrogenase
MMECADGKVIHAWWGKSALGYANGLSVEVFGSDGSARWVQMEPEFLRIRTPDGVDRTIHRGSLECRIASEHRYNRFKAGHPDGFIEAFANCYWDIADALSGSKNGKSVDGSYLCGAEDGSKTIKVLDAASKSARQGQWTQVSIG